MVWSVVALGVFGAGAAASWAAAETVVQREVERSRSDFARSSTALANDLELAIQHEEDLVAYASAFILERPDATNAHLEEWTELARMRERHPEVRSVGVVEMVPASELDDFAARAATDPTTPLVPGVTFSVSPPGERPFYCLATIGVGFAVDPLATSVVDYCTGETGEAALSSRDSGRSTHLAVEVGPRNTWLVVQTPMYAGGVVPPTVEARRSAFVGWVGIVTDPQLVLDRAAGTYPSLGAAFRHESAEFVSGDADLERDRSLTDLGEGWTLETYGDVEEPGLLHNSSSLVVFAGGVGFSAVLAFLIVVLVTGRDRALVLVDRKTEELRHQALHDPLTGLPNRTLLMDRLERLRARSRRDGTGGATMFLDLDGFKDVNDTLGHDAGDQLLRAISERLTVTLRDADTIGRIGGDEFVILIDGGTIKVAPERVAERVLDVMAQPFDLDASPQPVMLTTSIGIAVGLEASADDLLRGADMALYAAKAAGRNRYELFRPEMEEHATLMYDLAHDLDAAWEGEQFRLVYQPIYDLSALGVVGVEALIRWDHPVLGEVQPGEFISLLESTNRILEVGRWALTEACRQMAVWRDRGSGLFVSVNISARQLESDDFVGHVGEALAASGLAAERLIIEITETALVERIDDSLERLATLKSLGVQIAIDDFGTGYSSLARLETIPVDCLKIDRTFTGDSDGSEAIVRTFVELGRALGLRTLAEGVENPAQMSRLRIQEVDEVQGFYLARPVDPETLEAEVLGPERLGDPTRETSSPR